MEHSLLAARRAADVSAVLIQAPPYGSAEWVAWRDHGLGASELPTVVGCNPYQTEYQLASLKRGDTPAFEGSAATRWGHRMEAIGIEVWQEATGLVAVTGETFGDPRWPHLWASLDGRAGRIGAEVKWTARWDEVPSRVTVQALGQIGLADLDAVDVVRLSPYGEPTITRIERDDAAVTDLLDLGEAWYLRFVLGDEWPPLDGSPEARRALDRLVGTDERPADERQVEMLADLRRTREALERLTTAEDRLVRDIKASMAGAGVLTAPGVRVTWAPVKGRTTTDWKALAASLAVAPEIIAEHTTTGEPTTRFAVKYEEETA